MNLKRIQQTHSAAGDGSDLLINSVVGIGHPIAVDLQHFS